MSHLSVEQQWQLARGELPPDQAPALEAHAASCEACRAAVASARAAVNVLREVPEPPPLPSMLAQRVGVRLSEALEAEQSRRFTRWWSPGWAWAAVAAAVVVVAGVAWVLPKREVAPPVAVAPEPVKAPVVAEPVMPPPPLTPRKLAAVVASASKASASKAALATAQELAEGAVVKTERGGAAWLHLPDGTRAGLTGSSSVQLVTLEASALTLEVQRGSVAMVVPHREDRVLIVRAGEVQVRDLGTQFLVSREAARVVVAVEEGEVAVDVANQTRVVKAGHAVVWHDGVLEPLTFAPPPVKAAPVRAAPAVAPASASESNDDIAPPPASLNPEDEWAGLTPERSSASDGSPPPNPSLPPPPPSDVATATPPSAPRPRGSGGFSLRDLERRIDQLMRDVRSPFPPAGGSLRQARAREVAHLADDGRCDEAIALSDAWLSSPAWQRTGADEGVLRRAVLQQKMRCLTSLGRNAEATDVWRELTAQP
ncbi:MAG: FecR domain-containing protein [Archangium sp.]|nr:FecR domain-containing protein [Archangium sp.]